MSRAEKRAIAASHAEEIMGSARCASHRTALQNGPIIGVAARWSRERGFTLIELMVVASLMVILATMGLVQYRQSVVRTKEAVLKEDLFRMRDAIDQYYADKNEYPSTLEALVSSGYLRQLPKDPFTNSDSTWQTIQAEPDPNSRTIEAGVYDVKSGADQAALDGSQYSTW
jgi:general secretion pathway protein G